jgi:mxaD protein
MKVVVEEKVAAPVAKVFAIAGDFGGLEKNEMITDFTVEGSGVGAVRTITLAGGGVIVERLEKHDPAAATFTYAIINEQTALPVKNYVSTVVVTADGANGSIVNWSSTFDAVGLPEAQVEAIIGGVYKGGIARTRQKLGL